MDNKERLEFHEFDAISEEAYLDRIKEELKNKSLQEIIENNSVDGISYTPSAYSNYKSIPENFRIPLDNENRWKIHVDIGQNWKNNSLDVLSDKEEFPDSVGVSITDIKEIPALLNVLHPNLKSISISGVVRFPDLVNDKNFMDLANRKVEGWMHFDPIFDLANESGGNSETLDSFFGLINTLSSETSIKGLNIQSHVFKDAGATIVQEIAITLNLINEYLIQCEQRGIPKELLLNQMVVSMAHHTDYFLEIAKYRAIRVLFQTLCHTHGLNKFIPLTIHGKDSNLKLSGKDVDVNLLRHTTGAMSAIVGGVDFAECAVHQSGSEESNDAIRLARNILILLKHESDIGMVKDPAHGSYLIELITYDLVNKAWAEFKRIENKGGFIAGMKDDSIPNEVEVSANKKMQDFREGKIKMVGSNIFPSNDQKTIEAAISRVKGKIHPLVLETSNSPE